MKFLVLFFILSSGVLVFATSKKASTIAKIPLSFRDPQKPGLVAEVVIKGQKFRFLIDTGASAHSIDRKVAEALGFSSAGDVQSSTPYGPGELAHLGDVNIKVGSLPLILEGALSTPDDPGGLVSDGISGVISPPRLSTHSFVVVDLKAPALYFVQASPQNIWKWLENEFSGFDFDELNRLEPNSFQETIKVRSKEFGSLQMFIDTGATTTILHAKESSTSPKLMSLGIGHHQCETRNARILPLNPEVKQNLLGMDCLRNKILVFGPPSLPMVWMGWPK